MHGVPNSTKLADKASNAFPDFIYKHAGKSVNLSHG